MEDLPNYFDVIVVGTGMPECIIAAAAARVGKKVLHLDRNGYYGGDWASFSYDKFLEWMNEIQSSEQPCQTPIDLVATLASFVREEETLYTCPLRSRTITNLSFKSFVKDSPDPPPAAEGESSVDTQPDQASGGEAKEEEETVPASNSESADLVYMICRSTNATAEDDLKSAVELLFSSGNADASDDKQNQKPNVLWSVYFNQRDTSTISLNENLPPGVFLTSSPDLDLDYEHAVKEARDIFEAMCPGEEFLPRAPDPEDILIEMHNNPGDEGEGGKIENDVNGLEEDTNAHHNEQNVVNDEVASEQHVQETPENADENEQ
ncbi:unnamed protein product [Larinioides sclopetarius]|uniref:RAE1/2 domain-containing protein n=1 Tax=Larinioides sclopetarius TaxID=280406 RepID=A0AAV2A9E4_9ARAC